MGGLEMATMEQQYQKIKVDQTYYVYKEWNEHKKKMMDHIATIMDQQKVVYDGLSETWDIHGEDLRAQVSSEIKDGNAGWLMLSRLITNFSNTIYQRQFKATNERMNGHFKVLKSFHGVVARADALINDIEGTLNRRGDGTLSLEHCSAWAKASNQLTGQFALVLEVGNVEKYQLLDIWEEFHVTGRKIIFDLPNGENKKYIARAWETMARQMNAQVLQIIIEVRDRLEAIERDCYRSEHRLQQELSGVFKEIEGEKVDLGRASRTDEDDYSENT
jgi:hypothetical protein